MVADRAKARDADSHWTRKQRQRGLAHRRIESLEGDSSIGEFIDKCGSQLVFLGRLNGSFSSTRGEGKNISRFLVKAGDAECELILIQPMRLFVAKRSSLQEPAITGLQGYRMISPAKIDSCDIERHSGTESY